MSNGKDCRKGNLLVYSQGHLFCFGLGYSAAKLSVKLACKGWTISGTSRSEEKAFTQRERGYKMHVFDGDYYDGSNWFEGVTHVIVSVPPGLGPAPKGDPILAHFSSRLKQLPALKWLGYLSTTGVYGNTEGAWVDESSPLKAEVARSKRRMEAEESWQELASLYDLPLHIFRLAGIYGPGRNVLEQVRAGKARKIKKAGHQFSRIHVDDIAAVIEASIAQPNPGAVYNVCDDEPAAPADVIDYACELLKIPSPIEVTFEEVASSMSPMARSFWRDNRRVRNRRIKTELGIRLMYPTYKEGLKAIYEEEFSS